MKRLIDPETKARWAREDDDLRRFVEHRLRLERERERRRQRLRRVSFGLLGR
jgi:hypothetical protein